MKLGDVITLKRGYDLRGADRGKGAVPVVSSSGITGSHSEAKAKAPGVVTGRYGTLGEVFYLTQDFWPLNTTLYVKDFKGNEPRFIYYLLKSLDFSQFSDKSSVPGLNRNHLHEMSVRIPPPAEQRAIAHILGTLDDKIELNRRMNATLEATARAIFKSWFVDFDPVHAKARGEQPYGMDAETAALFPDAFEDSELGPIPTGWGIKRFGEISEKPQYGYTASAQDDPVGPKFLRIKDINKTPWIEWATVPYCDLTESDYEKYKLRVGDIVIARMADPGHSAFIEDETDAVFASYLIRFRSIDAIFDRYLQFWLRSSDYWFQVEGTKTGTTRSSLNAQVLSSFRLLLPPEEVATAFSRFVAPLRQMLVQNNVESQTLAALRDALLPRLISGEIRVEEAVDAVTARD